MPYKEKKGYRAKVRRKGKPYTAKCATRKEALEWEAIKRRELSTEKEILTVSLHEGATDYLRYCERTYTKETFSDKRKALKELIEVTGNVALEDIGPNIILNDIILAQPTSALANKRRKDLHAFFEHSRKFFGLTYNPISVIEKLPQERTLQPVATDGELAKLLLKCSDRQDRNMIIAFANSGARRSELFRLTFSEDIDFQIREVRLGNRKNRKREMRYRVVPMNEALYDALLDQFRRRLPGSDYVFQNRDKRHPNYGGRYTARRKFMRGICKEAQVKRMGFHALRRHFASKLIEDRETSLETVRDLLGHAVVSTTDKYVYRLKNDLRGAVDRIGKKKDIKKVEGANERHKV